MAASVAASVVIVFSFLIKGGDLKRFLGTGWRRGAAEGELFVSRVWCYLLYCYVCVQPSHQRQEHLVINTTVVFDSCITYFTFFGIKQQVCAPNHL